LLAMFIFLLVYFNPFVRNSWFYVNVIYRFGILPWISCQKTKGVTMVKDSTWEQSHALVDCAHLYIFLGIRRMFMYWLAKIIQFSANSLMFLGQYNTFSFHICMMKCAHILGLTKYCFTKCSYSCSYSVMCNHT
jgi:hypothetical protein